MGENIYTIFYKGITNYFFLALFFSNSLLNSNAFALIAVDAFAGLSHLQYLWVCMYYLLKTKSQPGGAR